MDLERARENLEQRGFIAKTFATAADAAAISLPGTLTISATVDVTGAPAADCQEVLAGEGAELSENSEGHIVAYAETAAL